MVRCMLKSKEMPAKFWGEAIKTVVYILNRSPTKGVAVLTSGKNVDEKQTAEGKFLRSKNSGK